MSYGSANGTFYESNVWGMCKVCIEPIASADLCRFYSWNHSQIKIKICQLIQICEPNCLCKSCYMHMTSMWSHGRRGLGPEAGDLRLAALHIALQNVKDAHAPPEDIIDPLVLICWYLCTPVSVDRSCRHVLLASMDRRRSALPSHLNPPTCTTTHTLFQLHFHI